MLGYRFSFEVYTKNIREKATRCSLRTAEVLLDAGRHVLATKFDIYQGTVAPDWFKSDTNSWYPEFF